MMIFTDPPIPSYFAKEVEQVECFEGGAFRIQNFSPFLVPSFSE